jgi:hypothetical protein
MQFKFVFIFIKKLRVFTLTHYQLKHCYVFISVRTKVQSLENVFIKRDSHEPQIELVSL